jgi:hypothetical protein
MKMDMLQFRASPEVMDKVTFVALVIAVLAVISAGVTSWLSGRYHRSLAVGESAVADHYRAELADKTGQLEKEIASTRDRSAQLERNVAEATDKATASDRRAGELEKSAQDAKARVATLEKELADTRKQADRQLAEARDVGSRARVEEKPAAAVEPAKPSAEEQEVRHRQLVEALRKFNGTQAAIFAVGEVPDAAEGASSVKALLSEAGWSPFVWTWMGVGGIVGVGVVTSDGGDSAIEAAAEAVTSALSSSGFRAVRVAWPKDADWRRVRGTFTGPAAPEATEPPIRIVIGAKSRI